MNFQQIENYTINVNQIAYVTVYVDTVDDEINFVIHDNTAYIRRYSSYYNRSTFYTYDLNEVIGTTESEVTWYSYDSTNPEYYPAEGDVELVNMLKDKEVYTKILHTSTYATQITFTNGNILDVNVQTLTDTFNKDGTVTTFDHEEQVAKQKEFIKNMITNNNQTRNL